MKKVVLNNILTAKSYPEAGTEFGMILQNAIEDKDTVQIDMLGVEAIPTML